MRSGPRRRARRANTGSLLPVSDIWATLAYLASYGVFALAGWVTVALSIRGVDEMAADRSRAR